MLDEPVDALHRYRAHLIVFDGDGALGGCSGGNGRRRGRRWRGSTSIISATPTSPIRSGRGLRAEGGSHQFRRRWRRLCAARPVRLRQDHAAQHHFRPPARRARASVIFDGRDVTNLPTQERNIAQVFQFPVIYDTMTVYDNLAFPLRNRGVPQADVDRQACARSLEMLGLAILRRRRRAAYGRPEAERSRSDAGWCAQTSTRSFSMSR